MENILSRYFQTLVALVALIAPLELSAQLSERSNTEVAISALVGTNIVLAAPSLFFGGTASCNFLGSEEGGFFHGPIADFGVQSLTFPFSVGDKIPDSATIAAKGILLTKAYFELRYSAGFRFVLGVVDLSFSASLGAQYISFNNGLHYDGKELIDKIYGNAEFWPAASIGASIGFKVQEGLYAFGSLEIGPDVYILIPRVTQTVGARFTL